MTISDWVVVAALLALVVVVGACCWDVEQVHRRQNQLQKQLDALTGAPPATPPAIADEPDLVVELPRGRHRRQRRSTDPDEPVPYRP